MKNIIHILKISKPLHKTLYLLLFLALASGIVAQIVPIFSKEVVDEIQIQLTTGLGDKERLIFFIGLTFAASILSVLISSLSQRIGDFFGGELRRFLLLKFYDHIFRLPQRYFDTELSGKIVNQLNRGVSSVQEFMNAASNFIFPSFLTVFLTLGLMFYYSWPVALCTIFLFPIYTSLSFYSSKKWGEKETEKNKYEDITRGRIQEVISNMRLVKGYMNQKSEYDFIDLQQTTVNKIYTSQSRTFHIVDFLRNVSLEIILLIMNIVIFYNAFTGVYTFGTVVLLIQLIAQIRRPLFAMSFILTRIQQTESGTKEYFEILNIKPEEKYEIDLHSEKFSDPEIEFKNVSFQYESSEEILKDINFKINKNEKVALVGHSGAGKSTIINLITKFYNPTHGEIVLSKKNYSDLSHNIIRSNIALVFQENELFSTTIKENVGYGQNASDEEIIEALKSANAWDFVKSFKNGIDTEIGERGIKLSGGQKQRIQIARAILHDSPIVILDEATSNLDSKSEQLVQEALDRLMKGRIVIIIAHRFSTIQNVDKVIVIDNGTISDQGAPSELAKRDGIYKQLLTYQVEGDKKLLKNFDIN